MSGSLCHQSCSHSHLHRITLTCILIICTCRSPIKPPIKSCSTQSQIVWSTVRYPELFPDPCMHLPVYTYHSDTKHAAILQRSLPCTNHVSRVFCTEQRNACFEENPLVSRFQLHYERRGIICVVNMFCS